MSTHNIQFSIKKRKITLNYPKFATKEFFFLGTQERVRNIRGNRPSVYEPLKFYCIIISDRLIISTYLYQ